MRLADTAHRPWPLPRAPWVMAQSWHDLLFAHWPVRAAALARLLPGGVELDTFDGRAWIGVVPFRMSGVRVRLLPPTPGATAFPELNVRTYVRCGDKPGVWFFSLDAKSRLAVEVARRSFHLPYHLADMVCEEAGAGRVRYESHRIDDETARFRASYGPLGEVFRARRGTLEHWLTERYCLFAADPRGRVLVGEIHHAPWPLQRAEAVFEENGMARAAGIELPDEEPHLLFARRLDVAIWPPVVIRAADGALVAARSLASPA